MSALSGWYLDRRLAPKAIDRRRVTEILQPHMPDHTLQELETLSANWAARDGYNCICQAPVIPVGD